MRNHSFNGINVFFLLQYCLIYFLSAYAGIGPDSVVQQQNKIIIKKLDVKNADLKDVARLLAGEYHINIIVDENVNKRVTFHFSNISFEDFLKFLEADDQLVIEKFGNIYRIKRAPLAPEPGPPEKAWKIDFEDGYLTVDLQDEDAKEAIYEMARITGKSIVVGRNVSGKLNGYIYKLPFDEAFSQLLQQNGLKVIKKGNIYLVHGNRPWSNNKSKNSIRASWINVNEDGMIDLEVFQVPLAEVIEEIFSQFHISYVTYGDLKGVVNTRAYGMSLEECLEYLLSIGDYTFRKKENIILIGEKTNKELIAAKLIKLRYVKVDGILENLPKYIINKAEIIVIKEQNALLVNASQDIINEIEHIIKEIDQPIPQILIEALVIDYYLSDSKEFSFQAGLGAADTNGVSPSAILLPGLDVYISGNVANRYIQKIGGILGVYNIGKLPADFYLRIKALESIGKANIRSRPLISTLNGHEAEIKIGQTQYYKLITKIPIRDPSQIYIQETEQFKTIEANTSLKIIPWVSASGEITIEIHPEFNNPVGQFSPEIPPTIQSRQLHSTVRLRDGETIVLGGLIQTMESENISKLPLLGSLPLIGRFFQSRNIFKRKSELIIYVTPRLSYSNSWLELE